MLIQRYLPHLCVSLSLSVCFMAVNVHVHLPALLCLLFFPLQTTTFPLILCFQILKKWSATSLKLKDKQEHFLCTGKGLIVTHWFLPQLVLLVFFPSIFSFCFPSTRPIRQAASMVWEAFIGCLLLKKYLSLFNLSYPPSVSSLYHSYGTSQSVWHTKTVLCAWAYSTSFSGLFCFPYCVCVFCDCAGVWICSTVMNFAVHFYFPMRYSHTHTNIVCRDKWQQPPTCTCTHTHTDR